MGLNDAPSGSMDPTEGQPRNAEGLAVHQGLPGSVQPATLQQSNIFDGQPGFMTTRLDAVVNWARINSLWPMPFGTACCAIEMMATAATRFDLARFGMERMSFSPRQADLLICAGRVSYKMAPVLKRIWEQMPSPKWAISMGACASTGGVFDVYSMVQGIDTIIPVDVYVPGCPPRPEALMYGILLIQEKIRNSAATSDDEWNAVDQLPETGSYLPREVLDRVTLPFGNSTNQNRSSGLVSTGAVVRVSDRLP
ncbi:NADH-quinone oxidoreductase subunit B [Longimicrobium terrae]|uniref:NADH-quinone oxidoreductase subunit B n=2 Tax=Longimicrobium terrae TaxID=1639882 RepID=A0A841H059_9BACT|nr:NADH-quinone oxidoreductase subunit B [Longimicrobium terrae]MBB6071356.1 NADH-quinone oxidoreductase subunit B [Longimicrobium terrae]